MQNATRPAPGRNDLLRMFAEPVQIQEAHLVPVSNAPQSLALCERANAPKPSCLVEALTDPPAQWQGVSLTVSIVKR